MMKVESINFIKEGTIPTRAARSGQFGPVVEQISAQLHKLTTGQELSVRLAGASKYIRYALQKRLQKNGHPNAYVSRSTQDQSVFVIGIGEAPRPKVGQTKAKK